ncbi:unnamed protein product, partial [Musa textilis]
ALYAKKPTLALVEFIQARFKNIQAGFHRCDPLSMALSSGWRSGLRLLRSWRVAHFSL